jgi:hypothetical protein
MSLRIRPLRLEALECRLAPAGLLSLLPPTANGLGLGHNVPKLDDAPHGLAVSALARGLSSVSSIADVNISASGISLSVSAGRGATVELSVKMIHGSGRDVDVIDVDVSVGKGKKFDRPPIDVPPVVVPPIVVPPVVVPPVVGRPPIVVPPIVTLVTLESR